MDPEAAKAFTKAIMTGAANAKDLIAQGITSAAQNMSNTQAQAKTGASLKEIEAQGGAEKFIHYKESSAISKGTTEATQADLIENPEKSKAVMQKFLNQQPPEERARLHKIMQDKEMLESDSTVDNLKPTSGHKARAAWAKASAGAMNRDMGVMIGEHRLTPSQDATTNDVRMVDDDSNTRTTGDQYNYAADYKVMEKTLAATNGGRKPEKHEVYEALSQQKEGKFASHNWGSILYGGAGSYAGKFLESAGIENTEENREVAAMVIGGSALAVGASGITDLTALTKKAIAGNRIVKKDFTYTDSNGEQKTVKAGTEVNVKTGKEVDAHGKETRTIPGLQEHYKSNSEDFRFVRSGPAARGVKTVIGGATGKLKSATDKLRGINNEALNDAPNTTNDSSPTKHDGDSTDKAGNKPQDTHIETPVNKDKPIIPQKPEAPQFNQALGINTGNLNTPADVAKEMQRVQEMKPGELGAKILNDRVNAELSSPDLTPERKEALETVRNKIQSNNPRDPLTKFDLDRAGLKNAVVTSPVTSEWKDKKTGEPRSRTTHVADFTKTGQNIKNDAMNDLREHGNELTRHNRAVSEVKSAADTSEQAPADNKSPDTQEQRTKSSDAKQKVLDHINSIPDEKAGQMSLSEEIRAKKAIAAPPQHAALTKMQRAIDAGLRYEHMRSDNNG